MNKAESELKAEVDKWFAEAEAIDRSEDEEHGRSRRGDEMPEWVAHKQKRLEKIREAKAALEGEAREKAKADGKKDDGHQDRAQRNFTDPESAIMKMGNGFEQCYNAQAAVDAKSQVIVAQALTNESNDQRQLDPMLSEIKKNMGRHAEEISADAGYCSEENLKKVNRRHINAYIATGRQKHGKAAATGNKSFRQESRVHAMMVKLKQGGYRSRYRLRKQSVEPVFGQIKQGRSFRQFLMRGVEKVSGEWAMLCSAHNLLKLAAVRM
jgi:hypothetical protein